MTDAAARAIALRLKWSMPKVRALLEDLEQDGVHVTYRPVTTELCPCGYHVATESGLCVTCETERELERQKEADYAEEARLAKMTERRVNQVKKARERMRRRHLANPRDTEARQMLAVVDAFIALMEAATDEEWEDANADMEAAIF